MAFSELVKTLILDPIEVADDLWLFKVEIFRHLDKGYFATLWRLDTYDIKPTFAILKDWQASESFFIDESFRIDGLGLYGDDLMYFDSLDDCQDYVLKCLNDEFDLS